MKKMTMLAVLMGVILVAGTVNAAGPFVVYKTSATVQQFDATGASAGKNTKVETYTILDTTATVNNAYSIWFGKVNKVKVYAGTVYGSDPAFGNFNDMFRGYDTYIVKSAGAGSYQVITSFEAVETAGNLTDGLGQMYVGKIGKSDVLSKSLKGAYTWYSTSNVKLGLSVNRSLKYDKKMTSAAATATSMNAAASAVATILYKDGKGYASQGGNP